MKKGWKIFWIVIAVITTMGMAFCVIALCMGVDFRRLGREYSGSRLARIIDYWDGDSDDWDDDYDDWDDWDDMEDDWDEDFHDGDDEWDDADDQHHGSGEATVLPEYDFKDITEIRMSLGKCRVNIQPTSQDYIHIDTSRLYFPEYNMELKVEREGDVLNIETLRDGKIWDVIGAIKRHEVNGLAGVLNIYIPRSLQLTRAEIIFGGCDVAIDGMNADEVILKGGASDCEAKHITFGSLNAEVGAGDLELEGTVNGNISAKCGAGDMDFKLNGREKDYNYSLKCGVGDVEINDHDYGGLANVKKIDNHSDKTIDIVCGAGDVNIEFTTH